MRNPHTVRLDGSSGSLMLTRRVSDLEFTNIENGGFGSGTFTLQRPIDRKQLETYSEVLIFDGRNGKQVTGGRILTPGRSSSDQGQVAKIAFLGEGPAVMGAVERPYALIDQNIDSNFVLSSRSTRRLEYSTSPYPGSTTPDDPNLFLDPTDSVTVATNAELVVVNRLGQRCDQLVGSIFYRLKSGLLASTWRTRIRMYSNDLTGWDTPADDGWDTTISSTINLRMGVDWSNPRQVVGVQWKRTGADVVTGETTWSVVRDVILRFQLYGANGSLRTDGLNNPWVGAGEAFTDWCVRNCPTFDMTNANVTPGTYHFDQLSWPEGIDGLKFMDELLSMEQGLMWGVFEKQANGKYRTELIQRSTQVRYELSIADGYDESSPADELSEVVYVLWTSPGGKPQMTRVPSTGASPVDGLENWPGYQSKVLNLGDEVGSLSQATQRGLEWLEAHSVVPNGGTLTVNGNRRIRDLFTGRLVAPWEIVPGYVGRIAGLAPRPDTLNPQGSPDGSTLTRIVSMNWSDSRSSAQLQLDAYRLDQYRMIANLMKRRTR